MNRTQPFRTCLGCREVKPKRDMLRLVRQHDYVITVDETGKRSGRGVYMCPTLSCWDMGLRGNKLEHALRGQISPESRLALLDYRDRLKGE